VDLIHDMPKNHQQCSRSYRLSDVAFQRCVFSQLIPPTSCCACNYSSNFYWWHFTVYMFTWESITTQETTTLEFTPSDGDQTYVFQLLFSVNIYIVFLEWVISWCVADDAPVIVKPKNHFKKGFNNNSLFKTVYKCVNVC